MITASVPLIFGFLNGLGRRRNRTPCRLKDLTRDLLRYPKSWKWTSDMPASCNRLTAAYKGDVIAQAEFMVYGAHGSRAREW